MKRRSQFSLQSLMLWLVLTGLALGWWGDNRRYASRAAELENQVLELTIALQETERGLERYGVDFSYSISRGKIQIDLEPSEEMKARPRRYVIDFPDSDSKAEWQMDALGPGHDQTATSTIVHRTR